jgi:hypothetical protein
VEERHTLTEHDHAEREVVHADTISEGCIGGRLYLHGIEERLVIMRGNINNIFLRITGITGRRAVIRNQTTRYGFAIGAHDLITGEITRHAKTDPIGVVVELDLLVFGVA